MSVGYNSAIDVAEGDVVEVTLERGALMLVRRLDEGKEPEMTSVFALRPLFQIAFGTLRRDWQHPAVSHWKRKLVSAR